LSSNKTIRRTPLVQAFGQWLAAAFSQLRKVQPRLI
jgi:hypothetical protein